MITLACRYKRGFVRKNTGLKQSAACLVIQILDFAVKQLREAKPSLLTVQGFMLLQTLYRVAIESKGNLS